MSSFLTQQEVEDYGPEFVDVMRRVVAEATMPLNAEIDRLRGQMSFAENEASRAFLDRMHTTLDQLVPGWSNLNRDPAFVAWSHQADEFSGRPRNQLMQEAWNSGDAQRVANFFTAYLRGGGTVSQYLPQGHPAQQQRPILRGADVKKFYDEKLRGKWVGREKEAAAIEAEIMAAGREGRVR